MWALAAGLEAAAVPRTLKILFSTLEYLGSGLVAPAFLSFSARHSGHDGWMRGTRKAAVWMILPINVTLAATNGLHHWVWTAFTPGIEGTNLLVYHHGPGFFAILAVLYIYFLFAAALLFDAVARPVVVRRRQSLALLLASLFPLVAGMLYAFGFTILPGLNLAPASLVITGLVFLTSMEGFRVFDLVPIARDVLIERMPDGVLVIDRDDRIVDMNPAAKHLLDLDKTVLGKRAGRVLPFWGEAQSAGGYPREGRFETMHRESPVLYVDVLVSPLTQPGGDPSGCLLVVRDITQRYQAQAAEKAYMEMVEALKEKLEEQVIRDALTGTFNRRYLNEYLPRRLERAGRGEETICAILFDIDHFKAVNDRYGHKEGDRLLEELGGVLRHSCRTDDVACRYGGEEFVLVLPSTSIDTAVQRAEDIRAAFVERSLASDRGATTLSAGIACYPQHGTTDDGLLAAADAALYAAKAAGRNTCVVAPAPQRAF